ncbi:putative defensin-like protein 244 [Ricinus communis]|uniref:Protein SCRL10, putative n=1 Tax=Ricinus communis TaxID=3988 RepID=B9SXK1_RICCO|nr:putative defensin-like protein 244 [Ricinus communis]EEF31674.1 Protein SCRL10 precursor, putative [Ricinus communis]|eukprot:XP_002530720.1 putative defensin-like protein 244 [Ricinus communis]
MVKAKIIFVLSCMMLLLNLSTVHTQGDDDIKWCPKQEIFGGGSCPEWGPRYQCFLDFLGKYGASSMPKNCECQSSGTDKRLCTCDIVCSQF